MGNNKWLTMFAWLALALTATSVTVSADIREEPIEVDSAILARSAWQMIPGYFLNHPCGLVIRCYDMSTFVPVSRAYGEPSPEDAVRGTLFDTGSDLVYWAEDTLTRLDLEFERYGHISYVGLKLHRDSICTFYAYLSPGYDDRVFDLSEKPRVRSRVKNVPTPLTQKGSIAGVVCNAETSEPIEGARVSLPDELVSTITDDSGKFSLQSSQFGNDFRVHVAHGDYDTVDVGLRKMLPQTELRLQIFLTERPSWWQKLFAKKEERGLLQIVHFDWWSIKIDQKRMAYRIDLVKSWDGDNLSRRLGLKEDFFIESIDSIGAWIKFDSVAYQCMSDPSLRKPTPVGSQPTGDRRFGSERIGRKKVEFQSNTVDGGDTYGIQWIRTEE